MLQSLPSTMLTTRLKTLRFLVTTLALTTLAFAGACASSASTSSPRVVVMPISGSDSAHDTVNKVVDRRYDLVSGRRYKRAAKELDAKSSKSKDIRKVSRKLDVDAVVVGELVKKGKKKYELRLVLRAGESGKEFDSVTVKLRSKRLGKKDVRKVQKKLYSALSVVDSWERSVDDGDRKSDRGSRSRSGSKSSKKEMARARKMRERKHEKSRRDDERRAKRDEKRRREKEAEEERRDRKRAEKERRKEEKLARRRDRERDEDEDDWSDEDEDDWDDEDEDEDEDRDSRRKSKRSKRDKKSKKKSKKEKKSKKKKKKEKEYEVITVRDDSGQALDEEDPF